MSSSKSAGVVALFEPAESSMHEAVMAELTLVERRLVVGAANFRALTRRGRARMVLHRGEGADVPRLTSPGKADHIDIGARPQFAALDIVLPGSEDSEGSVDAVGDDFHVLLSPRESRSDASGSRLSLYWRLRNRLETRYPMQYDLLRQLVLSRREKALHSKPAERRALTERERAIAELPVRPGRQRAVLIGMHWLDLGGAERWAVETVSLARDAGLMPIVITDRESHHPWIARPEFEGAVVIPLSFPLDEPSDDAFLGALFAEFDIVGVIVHHCAWLYDRLPLIRQWRPGVHVVDSLHIIEYAGGGYPATGVHLDPFIDTHHVISPQLADWMTGPQRIAPNKVALAPLAGLTVEQQHSTFVDSPTRGLRIGFVGRFVRQKRPYLFLKLIRRLHEDGVPITAIMHGGGELESDVRRRIREYHLEHIVEIRDHGVPVEQTLREIDLLVVSSQNEGITLTTFESLAAGVPVLSADVGSQDTIVPPEMLAPRAPHDFVDVSSKIIARLVGDNDARRAAWHEQMMRARAFSAQESATEWMRRTLRTWNV